MEIWTHRMKPVEWNRVQNSGMEWNPQWYQVYMLYVYMLYVYIHVHVYVHMISPYLDLTNRFDKYQNLV